MNILLCAPYFADDGYVGSKRMVSMARYLAEKGHRITVLRHKTTPEAELDIPGVRCIDVTDNGKYPHMLAQYLYERKTYKTAVSRQLRQEHYDVVMNSMGPFSTCAAMVKASKMGLPAVLDYRDMGVLATYSTPAGPLLNRIKNKVASVLFTRDERGAVKAAAAVDAVSPGDIGRLEKGFGTGPNKLHLIMNGFDDEQLKDLPTGQADDGKYYIGFFGKLLYYCPEVMYDLFNAIDQLRREGTDICLLHVGPSFEDVGAFLKNNGYDPACYLPMGSLPYRQGMEVLRRADMFAIEHRDPVGYGTKVFDYIFLDRPVLLLARSKRSELGELVGKFKHGYTCSDRQEIYDTLRRIIDQHIRCLDDGADKMAYSRSRQNALFEEMLSAAAGSTAQGS